MTKGPKPRPIPADFRALFPVTANDDLAARYATSVGTVIRWARSLELAKNPEYISELRANGRRHAVEQPGMKRCIGCGELKPIDDFYDASSKRSKMPRCKPCHGRSTNTWRHENPEAARKITRRSHLKKFYGITDKQWDALLETQDGKCAICGREDDGSQAERQLHTDHCHDTGSVRGLLCGSCNSGIGRFRHDIDLLIAAIRYLKNPPAVALLDHQAV